MKRAPYPESTPEQATGRTYWRSLEELAHTPEFQEAQQREFPDGASELLDPVSRRTFLSLMGASSALAGLAGCRRPEEKIVPYARAPEEVIPGLPQFYATAMPLAGTAVGLLVESHEGRPTKVEGNPQHPESLGALNVYGQSTVLDLYDPDRSTWPLERGGQRTWQQAEDFLRARGATLKAQGGKGLVVLSSAHRSPTLAAVLRNLQKEFPAARVLRYDPYGRDHTRQGAQLAFGKPLEPVLHLDKAQVILSLDADFLMGEASPVRQAQEFAKGRKLQSPQDGLNRLYVVESTFTVTGANADHRLRVRSHQVADFLAALARELSTSHGVELGALAAALGSAKADALENGKPWVRAVAKDLAAHRGSSVLVAGQGQPAAVHALCHVLNAALGNVGATVDFLPPFDAAPEGAPVLQDLVASIQKGEVDTLLVMDVNPVFTAPGEVDFAGALKKVPYSVHLGTHVDETGEAATWHLNRAHDLESWSDLRAQNGTVAIVQPLIAPLFAGKTDAEVVDILVGPSRRAYDLVRGTWHGQLGALDFEKDWRSVLHQGLVPGQAWTAEKVEPRTADVVAPLKEVLGHKADGLEVTFHPDSHAGDGRWANCGWLQEMPDPMTKVTWDNAAWFSPATASRLGLEKGDVVRLTGAGGKPVEIPVMVAPGQADDSISLTFGQGRTAVGRVGKNIGFNTYPLRTVAGAFQQTGIQVQKLRSGHTLAITQGHHVAEGRPLVRERSLAEYRKEPDFAQKMVEHPPLLSLFPDYKYEGHKWGMVIDLNSCIGCNACMVACQAENNIPVVGKFSTNMSREMHWIRVDRYYEGEDQADPNAVFQPVPCMHCENAPCEQVCPVAATNHSPEGLNDMAYNRCIGTRYCANNCPYKVRRFNFVNYAKDMKGNNALEHHGQFIRPEIPDIRKLQFNPDVTVRSRGVMEKCTYCVQRINEAKIAAKREGRDRVHEGEVKSACQQTCPTQAIHFGDLNDPSSDVAKQVQQQRNYALLEEMNFRPRTTYLAKVRNPNPELEKA